MRGKFVGAVTACAHVRLNGLQFAVVSADNEYMHSSKPRYTIDSEARLVSVKFAGMLTFGDIADYAASLRADPRFRPALAEIVDLRLVQSLDLSPREMMDLADKVDPFSFDSRRAFVVYSKAQIHAAQLHRILRKDSKTIRVFYSIDEANEWVRSESTSPVGAGVREEV